MSQYRAYPAYKDSGVEWIGQVPEHWEVKPICRVTSVNDDVLPDSTTDDTPIRYVDISSVGYMEGIKQASDMCFADAPSRARRKASSGDVIISTVRTYLKAVAAVTDEYADCVFSTGFAVLRARHLDRSFLKWMVLNELLIQAIEAHSEGLSYPAINASALVKLKSVIPPPEEQASIAATLDRETARIDALIEKKTRFIELLKEKRQALITHAVTKGLDPNAKMKDSGVEWIGQVPEHWEVKPICRVTSVNDDVLPDSTTDDTPIRYVDISSVGYMEGIKQASDMCFADAPSRARRKASSGDVIISTVRTYLKAVAAVTDEYADCVFSTGFAVLRARHLDRSFLKWMVLNELLIQAIEAHSEGLSYPAINASALVKLKSVIPPPEEQASIAATLDRETARIDALIEKKTRFIELLKEKRQALITHAVTKGLDPNVKMKDSGVEWIGQVPEHWKVARVKRLASLRNERRNDVSTDTIYIGLEDVEAGSGQYKPTNGSSRQSEDSTVGIFYEGDVLYGKLRPYLRKAIISEMAGCCSTEFLVLRAEKTEPRWLQEWLLTPDVTHQIVSGCEGAKMPRADWGHIGSIEVVYPDQPEQAKILTSLDRETARIDALISKTEQSITLLKERRAAFITAAVTGQIDLRGKQ